MSSYDPTRTMSMFAVYFAAQLLREAGWPRKLGRFKGVGYDAVVADLAFAQSIEWGAALGAGRPRVALQMIAEMFRDRDWESDQAPDVRMFLDGAPEARWSTADSPQDAVKPPELAKGMDTISVEQFKDPKLRTTMEQLLLQALLWGLSNPDRFEAWYGSMLAHRKKMLPMTQAADVQADLPSLQDFFESSTQIIGDYERDIGPLPSIPRRLLDDAAALGWVSETQSKLPGTPEHPND